MFRIDLEHLRNSVHFRGAIGFPDPVLKRLVQFAVVDPQYQIRARIVFFQNRTVEHAPRIPRGNHLELAFTFFLETLEHHRSGAPFAVEGIIGVEGQVRLSPKQCG